MGVYTIGNVSAAALVDRTTKAIKMPFQKMDDLTLTMDGSLTPVNAGPGMLPVWMISADRKPSIEVKGSEIPLDGLSSVMGANFTPAAEGTPVTHEWIEYKTIGSDGTLPLRFPISATNLTVSIVGGGTTYTASASAPTTGEYQTPVAGDTKITFSATDADKFVMVLYYYDATSASQVDYMPTSIPGTFTYVSTGSLLDAETDAEIPCIIRVPRMQLNGDFAIDEQRMKASATDLKFNILDPGGSNPAVTIIADTSILQ